VLLGFEPAPQTFAETRTKRASPLIADINALNTQAKWKEPENQNPSVFAIDRSDMIITRSASTQNTSIFQTALRIGLPSKLGWLRSVHIKGLNGPLRPSDHGTPRPHRRIRSGLFWYRTPDFGHNNFGKFHGGTCYNLFPGHQRESFRCFLALLASLTVVVVMGRDVFGTHAADFCQRQYHFRIRLDSATNGCAILVLLIYLPHQCYQHYRHLITAETLWKCYNWWDCIFINSLEIIF
jgi:hypothetical protein